MQVDPDAGDVKDFMQVLGNDGILLACMVCESSGSAVMSEMISGAYRLYEDKKQQ